MKRTFLLLNVALCLGLPALSQVSTYRGSAECACNHNASPDYNDELAGGYYDRANHLTQFRPDLPIMKIIKVVPDNEVPKFDGVIIHRGGEVTYTSPDRRIYSAMPVVYRPPTTRRAKRPSRVKTVGNTRIVYAPEAFGPASSPASKD